MKNDSIFISYARLDQDFVLQLAQALKDRGLWVWVDQWSIPPGADCRIVDLVGIGKP